MSRPAGDWRDELFARRTLGVRPGLAAITKIDEALGSPCAAVPMVHVVGTNGKGSTASMIAHLLMADGDGPVGLFTSPHLHRVGERVCVDGQPIDDDSIRVRMSEVVAAEAICRVELSFFEVLTMVALLEFEEAGVRSMVLEAGLGGRLDATRVRTSRVIAFTSIDLDHQEFLGETLAEIAQEKAAVMHTQAHVVAAPQAPEVRAVLESVATRDACQLRFVDPTPRPPSGLVGVHQRINAGLAMAAVLAWRGEGAHPRADLLTLDGVRLPGRFEVVRHGDGTLVFDVAHNPAGFDAVSATVHSRLGIPDVVLVGWSASRDERAMLNACPRGRMMGWVPLESGQRTPDAPWDFVFSGPDDPKIPRLLCINGGFGLVCGSHRVVGPIRAAVLGRVPADHPGLTDPTV